MDHFAVVKTCLEDWVVDHYIYAFNTIPLLSPVTLVDTEELSLCALSMPRGTQPSPRVA